MEKVQKNLMTLYWAMIVCMAIVAASMAYLYSELGSIFSDAVEQYLFSMVAVVSTLAVVPLSLRLFRFRMIRRAVDADPLRQYEMWAQLRLSILCGVNMMNIVFYGLTGLPSFVYLGIIITITFVFVYPSLDRCKSEANYVG
ncbi:MAG: hypothetical protein IJ637_06455 [Prevotella sp.]|nr:hypothetical protein [Prevotella sp.]